MTVQMDFSLLLRTPGLCDKANTNAIFLNFSVTNSLLTLERATSRIIESRCFVNRPTFFHELKFSFQEL